MAAKDKPAVLPSQAMKPAVATSVAPVMPKPDDLPYPAKFRGSTGAMGRSIWNIAMHTPGPSGEGALNRMMGVDRKSTRNRQGAPMVRPKRPAVLPSQALDLQPTDAPAGFAPGGSAYAMLNGIMDAVQAGGHGANVLNDMWNKVRERTQSAELQNARRLPRRPSALSPEVLEQLDTYRPRPGQYAL